MLVCNDTANKQQEANKKTFFFSFISKTSLAGIVSSDEIDRLCLPHTQILMSLVVLIRSRSRNGQNIKSIKNGPHDIMAFIPILLHWIQTTNVDFLDHVRAEKARGKRSSNPCSNLHRQDNFSYQCYFPQYMNDFTCLLPASSKYSNHNITKSMIKLPRGWLTRGSR